MSLYYRTCFARFWGKIFRDEMRGEWWGKENKKTVQEISLITAIFKLVGTAQLLF